MKKFPLYKMTFPFLNTHFHFFFLLFFFHFFLSLQPHLIFIFFSFILAITIFSYLFFLSKPLHNIHHSKLLRSTRAVPRQHNVPQPNHSGKVAHDPDKQQLLRTTPSRSASSTARIAQPNSNVKDKTSNDLHEQATVNMI